MPFKKYIFLLVFSTILSLFSFFLVVAKINPENTNFIGFLIFYLTLFFALSGILSLFMICMRWIFIKNLVFFTNIKISLRQAILFSTTIVSFLLLKSIDVLRWWNIILIIGIVVGVELFSVSRKVGR